MLGTPRIGIISCSGTETDSKAVYIVYVSNVYNDCTLVVSICWLFLLQIEMVTEVAMKQEAQSSLHPYTTKHQSRTT